MAKKNQQVENVGGEQLEETGAQLEETGAPASRNRESMVVKLSPETLASIDEAVENFHTFGLKLPAARDLVAAEISRRCSDISAVALFAALVQEKLAALAGK